ncbi:MAG: hypothetical protein H7199_03710 [Burkholderiales bacterium]|nr:hypothetical protein [Flavobacterium sp.]
MAKNYYNLNNWSRLKSVCQYSLKKSHKENDVFHIGQSYRWLGIYYENISFNDSAFYCYSKAEKSFTLLNNQKSLCEIYQDEAQVKYYTNDYVGAEYCLVKASRIATKFKLDYQKIRINLSLGLNCAQQGDNYNALKYYNKALVLSKEINLGFDEIALICVNNIGQNYFNSGNLRQSFLILNECKKKERFYKKYSLNFAFTLDFLAHVKLKLKDFNDIETLHFQAAAIREDFHIDQGKNFNKLYLSEYYYAINNYVKAKQYAQEAYNLSKSFRAPKDMLLSLKQLSIVNPQNALKYSQEYIKISDSMQQLERKTRNKFAKIAYETEEITNEKDAAIYHKEIFLGAAILIFVVGVLLFTVISQRIRHKELRFKQQQQLNNEEIYQLIHAQQAKINEGRQIEKKRIAQDLHDGIMNKLTSTRLNLYILNERKDPDTINKCLPFIEGIQKIEKEIRNIAHDLNKEVFSNADSFLGVIESLFIEQKSISTLKSHLEIDKEIIWDTIQSNKKIHLYRIIQEALNNVNKHAQASNIVVSILNQENYILAEIFDDGIGFSLKSKKKGIGLQNIFSRAKACDGSVEIKTKKGEGTTLIVKIPTRFKTKTA